MNTSYNAGFFDGEGCINFSKSGKSIFPRIMVVNTKIEILEILKEKFGGDIHPLSSRKDNWNVAYCWRIGWQRAVDFLNKIYPYLILKSNQADIVFAWDICRKNKKLKMDEDTRDLLVESLHWLNKRGVQKEMDPIERVIKNLKPIKRKK